MRPHALTSWAHCELRASWGTRTPIVPGSRCQRTCFCITRRLAKSVLWQLLLCDRGLMSISPRTRHRGRGHAIPSGHSGVRRPVFSHWLLVRIATRTRIWRFYVPPAVPLSGSKAILIILSSKRRAPDAVLLGCVRAWARCTLRPVVISLRFSESITGIASGRLGCPQPWVFPPNRVSTRPWHLLVQAMPSPVIHCPLGAGANMRKLGQVPC
mmetsp:Transcript_123044/g.244919  ORF Transcript_123044/g.244919 Transcript_123044/m.244919 type:complete len:212 (-) Transcript_123044:138-773(-)